MGFKRTTEGRVYFQRGMANDDVNVEAPKSMLQSPRADEIRQQAFDVSQGTQFEILSLLKSLNDRLHSTQKERNQMRNQLDTYREVIEDLEAKSDKTERAYLDLAGKVKSGASPTGKPDPESTARSQKAEKLAQATIKELQETRKALMALEQKSSKTERDVAQIKKSQAMPVKADKALTDMMDRIKRTEYQQEALTDQVEGALSQQKMLVEKIDRAVEDRARFMRKMERIEEAVLQTRDSLAGQLSITPNMIEDRAHITSDSNASPTPDISIGLSGAELPEALIASQSTQDTDTIVHSVAQDTGLLGGLFTMRAVPYYFLIAGAALAGWLVFSAVNPSAVTIESPYSDLAPQAGQTANRTPYTSPTTQTTSGNIDTVDSDVNTWQVETDTRDFSETLPDLGINGIEDMGAPSSEGAIKNDLRDDVGAIDLSNDQEVLRALESAPDDLASQLNAIEPGAVNPEERSVAQPSIATPEVQEQAPVSRTATKTETGAESTASSAQYMTPDIDLPAVIKRVEQEAMSGVAEAQHDLGAVYTAGHGGVEQDFERASFWFGKAADQGVTNAQYNLGVLYHQGLGVKTDLKKALDMYQRAAAQGHPEAQYNLGIAYIEGIGVTYNPPLAVEYFTDAANADVMEASYNLGLIYENGLLGKPDPQQALRWYKTAADKGSPEAKAALEQLAKALNIKPEEMNTIVDGIETSQTIRNIAPVVKSPIKTVKTSSTVKKSTARKTAKTANKAPLTITPDNPRAIDNLLSAGETGAQGVRVTRLDGAASNPLRAEQILVAQIQEQLMVNGLFPGPADGVMNPMTRDAIRSFQYRSGLNPTGVANQELLAQMLR